MKRLASVVERATVIIKEEMTFDQVTSNLKKLGATDIKGNFGDGGWLTFKLKGYKMQVKGFTEPSSYGINASGLSKLFVLDGNGKQAANYDRGWDGGRPSGALKDLILKVVGAFPPASDKAEISSDNKL